MFVMIKSPVSDPNRSVIRAVVEAAAQFHPVTAALARIYQTTHPSKFEQEVETWRESISGAANDHERRLAEIEQTYRPKLRLSSDAQALAYWLVQSSEKGLADPVTFDVIQTAFPDATKRELEDAAAELGLYGLVETSAALGHPVRMVTPTYELFALFDPVVMGTSPQDDAVEVARAALKADHGDARELESQLGWSKRRLNPALALIVDLIGEGRVRRVMQADYVTLGFMMSPEERVRLRQIVEGADRA